MGFWVVCKCDNCGIEENVEVSRKSEGDYLIKYCDDTGEHSATFISFEELAHYTDYEYRNVFIGGDERDPSNHKLLCDGCREEVREVDKELSDLRKKIIATALHWRKRQREEGGS